MSEWLKKRQTKKKLLKGKQKHWKKYEKQKFTTQISTDFKAKKKIGNKPKNLAAVIFIFFLKCSSSESVISKAGMIFPGSNKNVYSKLWLVMEKNLCLTFFFL